MLPTVPTGRTKTKRQMINFLGLHYGEGAGDGEFNETKNLSARKFPALTARGGRMQQGSYTAPSAVYGWNGLVAVDGTDLKIDGETVATVTPGEKQFAVVNTKLCVFPDKIYVDLKNNEVMPMEASVTSTEASTSTFTTSSLTIHVPEIFAQATATLVSTKDNYFDYRPTLYYHKYIRQYTTVSWNDAAKTWTLTGGGEVKAWEYATVGKYLMLKKSSVPGSYVVNRKTVKELANDEGSWVTEPFADNNDEGIYAKILSITKNTYSEVDNNSTFTRNVLEMTLEIHDSNYANGTLTKLFSVGCPVTITGADVAANNVEGKTLIGITGTTLTFADDTFLEDTQENQITVSRVLPDLDYVCESQNRLWGVSNTKENRVWNADTKSFDTFLSRVIYASALGDPTNFYLYEGTTLDSFAVVVGSEGDFTAICKYDRSVLCFKENTLHRIYGDYPAEYAITERPLFGVAEGAAGSLTNIGSVLYYLGRDGVYVFSGNTPTLISGAFGEKRFTRAYAGAVGPLYYLSAKEADGEWGLYVYDTRKGIWLREDDTFATSFATVDGSLYFTSAHEARTDTLTATVTPASGEAFTWTEGSTAADVTFENAIGPPQYDNMTVVSVTGTDSGGTARAFDAAFTGTNEAGDGLWTLTYHGTGDSAAHSVTGVVMTYALAVAEGGDALNKCDAADSDEAVEWSAEFAPFDEGTLYSKSPSKLVLRCYLASDAWIMAEISCDNEPWRRIFTSAGRGEPTLTIPIAPRRCDSYRVRLSGQGDCIVRSIERVFRVNSEWR